ncbi:MAG: AbrB/MazE/SpoVT family DNA-binding domain-containing protein [Defluviitaleaceae bacterium]|nr:AbrB/MazE/SpoVT family DNA-binding domain-containing protein [Defluviitaleaceae bacterium]
MEFEAIRTIDDLGRIVIPGEIRKEMGWEDGTTIAIYTSGNAEVLQESTGEQEE